MIYLLEIGSEVHKRKLQSINLVEPVQDERKLER